MPRNDKRVPRPWAHANDALAAKHSCVACHAKEQKMVGPAFKTIAAKYAGDAKAVDKLAVKVKAGEAGVWGSVPMPSNAQVPDGDVKALVGWILKMK
ncbi:c-type cytochrome [Variovorax sp. LARHSF232]